METLNTKKTQSYKRRYSTAFNTKISAPLTTFV